MSRSSKGRLLVVVALTSSIGLPSLAAGAKSAAPKVKVPGMAGLYVHRAVQGAQQRLADARCSAVLSDFKSEATGEALASILESKAVTPQAYLATILFVNGSEDRVCATGQGFAGMRRAGDDVVYVCPVRFRDLAQRDSKQAEAVVIHEMLHTLGLGENPPSSLEITARVMLRCAEASGARSARR
jgi:hypothetical protein